MLCPFASWNPVTNQGPVMGRVIGLVLHVQQGDGNLQGFFSSATSRVSAHFWVGLAGQIEQYVDTSIQAWAEEGGNPNYLSVEVEGYESQAMTGPQLLRLAQLLQWAASAHGFPMEGPVPHGDPGFTPHCNPNGTPDPAWGDHPCPGMIRLGQMGAILWLATAPPPTNEGDALMSRLACDPGNPGGSWALADDGGVDNDGPSPYLGSLAGNRFGWQGIGSLAGIVEWFDGSGWGFKIAVMTAPGGGEGGGNFDYYRFPSSGALKDVEAGRFEESEDGARFARSHSAPVDEKVA
jgi:hypothetical protein